MAQYTIYTSSDIGSPGPIYGNSGSLITILDACLVNGYGSHPAAGWTKPLPNTNNYACYEQGAGSNFTMFVNDNAPQTPKESQVTGWVSMTALTSSVGVTSANNVGAGYGQFPTPTQLLTIGTVVWRKSATADSTTPRQWVIAADAYTMNIWIQAGDSAGYYTNGIFGDFYSQYGKGDLGRCMLVGRVTQNSANGIAADFTDWMSLGPMYGGGNALANYLPGHFIARTAMGGVSSIPFSKKGDGTYVTGQYGTLPYALSTNGQMACPNPTDGNFYFSPFWLIDSAATSIRGKYRGIYQSLHAMSNFVDGQIIQGGGQYAGKTFMVVKQGYNGGYWMVETSNTLLTN